MPAIQPRRRRTLTWGLALLVSLVLAGFIVSSALRTSREAAVARLASMSEAQTAQALRVIVGRQEHCENLTRLFHAGTNPSTGDDYWDITCDQHSSYRVMVAINGKDTLLDCSINDVTGGTPCF